MSYREAFFHLSKLTGYIQCGHTFPSFYNQTDFINQLVFDQTDKLPFTFRIYEQRLFIEHNLTESTELARGDELIAIDEKMSQEILANLTPLIKADGPNNPKRLVDLNLSGYGKQEAFDVYYPLLYPSQNQNYVLKIRKSGSQLTKEVTLRAISRAERSKRLASLNKQEAEPLWQFELWENQTAYLKLVHSTRFSSNFHGKTSLIMPLGK